MSNSSINIQTTEFKGYNLGSGTTIYDSVNPFNQLNFKSLVGAGGIDIISGASEITISGSTLGQANTASNIGTGTGLYSTKVFSDLRFKTLLGGGNISISDLGTEIQISGTSIAEAAGDETQIQYNIGSGTGATDGLGASSGFTFSASTQSLTVGTRGTGGQGCRSFSHGYGNLASGINAHAEGNSVQATGDYSHAQGKNSSATGIVSHAGGCNTVASGIHSFTHGQNNTAQANNSAILGGCGNNIAAGNTNGAIIGGNGIDLTGTSYVDTTGVGSLAIITSPTNNITSDEILVRNTSTGVVDYISKASIGATDIFVSGGTLDGSAQLALSRSEGQLDVNIDLSALSGSSGEVNAGVNVGLGASIYTGKTGLDLQFKSLSGGSNIQLIETSDTITISAATGGGSTSPAGADKQIQINNAGLFGANGSLCFDTSTFSLTVGIRNGGYSEGLRSLSVGNGNSSEGQNSFSNGQGAHASGGNSFASGANSRAFASYSHAEGFTTHACGNSSHAEGRNTCATGVTSHAEGCNTKAIGDVSHVEGSGSQAIGHCSHAEGLTTCAIGDRSHAEGSLNKAYGIGAHVEGIQSQACGNFSHGEGNNTRTYGSYSHAEGVQSHACGIGSHAEGGTTKAIGSYSHASGRNTCAVGVDSFAMGNGAIASGQSSFAGGGACAIGFRSFAFGTTASKAYGNNSFAFGSGKSHGVYSFSTGINAYACAALTFAMGRNTCAEGQASSTFGRYVATKGSYSFASGCAIIGKNIYACGTASFIHSSNSGSATAGEGANANQSAILGGCNHNINSAAVRSAIIGGQSINLNSATYIDHTAVDKFAIFTPPNVTTDANLLTWNATTKKVGYIAKNDVSITSDKRLKTCIEPILNVDLTTICGVSFEFNELTPQVGSCAYGVIAQDVEKVYPLAVKDRGIEHNGNFYKTVDYNQLTPILLNKIKELEERIIELEK